MPHGDQGPDGPAVNNPIDSNVQKLAFYNAAIRYLRPPGENSVIIEPFGGTGKGSLSALADYKHYVCEMDEDRARAFYGRWPDSEIHCGDNREWLDSGFYADMDVVAVDFDATADPFDAFEIFIRHASLEKYCLAFFTWGFRSSPRLRAAKKQQGRSSTKTEIYHMMRQVVIDAAEPRGISMKSMGMAVPTIGKNPVLIYGLVSLVKKGGIHAEGEVTSDEQELSPSGPAATTRIETLDLDTLPPDKRADVLGRLQFTMAEIRALETGEPYERAVLTGEAQMRFAIMQTALGGSAPALRQFADIVNRRKYQERLAAAKAKLMAKGSPPR